MQQNSPNQYFDQNIASKGKNLLKPFKFNTNYLYIDFKSIKINIYVYDCQLTKGGKIVQFNSDLYQLFMVKIIKRMANVFGYHINLNKSVFSSKNFENQYYFYQKIQWRSQQIELKLTLKKNRCINIKQLLQNTYENEIKQKILRLFKICTKNKLKKIAISEPRQVTQVKNENISNQQSNFILNEGFKFNVHYLKNFHFLQVSICHRVIKKKTMKEQIDQIKQKQKLNEMFVGKQVICNYNSNLKGYPIVGIDFSMNPQSKFEFKNKKQNTFAEFYKNNYKIIIKDQNQPLIKVAIKKYKDKDPQHGHFVPELMSLLEKKQINNNNSGFKNQLAKINKISQQQKIMSEKRIVQKINENNKYLKVNNSLHLDGYSLNKTIIYLKDKQISCNQQGKIEQLYSLYQTPQLIKFTLIYSQNSKNDRQIKDILNEMIDAAQVYRIKLQPTHLKIKEKAEPKQWIESIRSRYDYKTIPQIFVFIFQQFEQSFYSKIKTFTINELQCVSQMIRTRNFLKNKKKAAAASQVIIQICTKMNYMPWKVKPQHPYFQNKYFIYGAFSISKGKNGQFLSFVGTTNKQCTKYYNAIKKINQISHEILQEIFIEWIKTYYHLFDKKVLPDSILIYRKGLYQSIAKQHFNKCEIKAIQNAILEIKKKTKRQKYSPGYQFVLVQQKSKTRFNYLENSQWGKKFKNPLPGCVITFSSLEENFQMISKYSSNGVQYPVKYKGGYGQPNIPAQALIMFTWEQCHNYYNSQGSIRVPACIAYANKLLNFVCNEMDQIIQQGQQTKTRLFYL